MNKLYFAIGLHFHQPVGNFEEIFERAYQNCYRPFLEVFSSFSELKITFHFSGSILDFLEKRHPEYLSRIKKLVDAGRVEIMGGGYYEPIFQAVPQRDRLGQIEMLSRYIKDRFGSAPSGIWTPERVWCPELVEDFHVSGMKYSILDDIHLIKAGVRRSELYAYYTAVHNGRKIAIFPSNKILRYGIPFKPVREIMGYLKSIAKNREGCVLTCGDDAEKFGEWPWTYKWVYKRGWLRKFFKELTRNQKWLETVTFSEYMDSHLPAGEADIPPASYDKMLEWSKGSWMNFLKKYPESDQMHKRMMHLSERLEDLEEASGKNSAADREKLIEAQKELYKGQCNCAYWHGVFGGIYLYHLRRAIYEHLINADKIMDDIEYVKDEKWVDVKRQDFYGIGSKAVTFENKDFFICIEPERGGIIREFDYKPDSFNLMNTLARRRELYHRNILDRINDRISGTIEIYDAIRKLDKGIKRGIFYDKHERACLVDHFIDKDLELEDFADCNYADTGDFAGEPYNARIEKEKIILSRRGKIAGKSASITKRILSPGDKEIKISYLIKNTAASPIDTFFGTEFNVTMPYLDSDRYNYSAGSKKLEGLDKQGIVSKAGVFSIEDSGGGIGIKLEFSVEPEEIWYFPLKTVSQSERSYDLSYQCSCIFPIWNIKLDKDAEFNMDITWTLY